MHPAWAGAGGNWPAIDEVFDPKVVKQRSNISSDSRSLARNKV